MVVDDAVQFWRFFNLTRYHTNMSCGLCFCSETNVGNDTPSQHSCDDTTKPSLSCYDPHFHDATRISRRLNWWCDSLFIYSIDEYGLLGWSMPQKYRHRTLQNNGRTQHQNPMSLRTHHTCAVKCDRSIGCQIVILWTTKKVSEKWSLRLSNTEALPHCSITQATVTNAFWDERKLKACCTCSWFNPNQKTRWRCMYRRGGGLHTNQKGRCLSRASHAIHCRRSRCERGG